jgi:hypothetical protein
MLQDTDGREIRPAASELKFVVPLARAREVLAWSRGQLAPDPHASGEFGDEYRTTTLYFDTGALDVYTRRGSFRRSKYRLRRYGSDEVAFVERKLRTNQLLTKRRTSVQLDDLDRLRASARDPGWAADWFHRRVGVRRMGPVCQISYVRVARVMATADGPARLTFDRDIVTRPTGDVRFLAADGLPVLDDAFIVEMKFRNSAPTVFRTLVEQFALEPTDVSKYRRAIDTLRDAGIPVGTEHPVPVDAVDA